MHRVLSSANALRTSPVLIAMVGELVHPAVWVAGGIVFNGNTSIREANGPENLILLGRLLTIGVDHNRKPASGASRLSSAWLQHLFDSDRYSRIPAKLRCH